MSFKTALMQQQPRIFTADGSKSITVSSDSSSGQNTVSQTDGPLLGASPSIADSFSKMPVAHRLNGNNYLQWSRFVLMFIRGRHKERYLTGHPPPPAPEDPLFDSWCVENNLVMAWLVNYMRTEIGETYLLANTAKEIWDSVKATYAEKENEATLLQVKRSLRNMLQGEQSVTHYYSVLVKLWQQIDLYEFLDWSCPRDALTFKNCVDHQRRFDFLLGLTDSFEDIRGRLMSLKPLPSLEEAFNMIKYEESQKVLIHSSSISFSQSNDSSALAVRGAQGDDKGKKSNKWWSYS